MTDDTPVFIDKKFQGETNRLSDIVDDTYLPIRPREGLNISDITLPPHVTLSAGRLGKEGLYGPIEDNGYCAQGFSPDAPFSARQARDLLESIFLQTRQVPATNIRGWDRFTPEVQREVATTAVGVVLGMEDVSVRNAGDSIAVAIGDNGNVVILNQLQCGENANQLSHAVSLGLSGALLELQQRDDTTGHFTWEELKAQLGNPGNIRIAVMSDGVCGSNRVDEIIPALQAMVRDIPFGAPDYARRLIEKARSSENPKPKWDDIVVLTALQPTEPKLQAALFAFDGVGNGGEYSAQVAGTAARIAQEQVQALARGEGLAVPERKRGGIVTSPPVEMPVTAPPTDEMPESKVTEPQRYQRTPSSRER